MTRTHLPVLLLGLLLAGMATGADGPTDRQRIDSLIQQLGSPRFSERQAASKQLEAIGAPVLDALKKVAAGTEPDKRRRSEELIARIESRLLTERLLKPTNVHLNCKAVPLGEAVAQLARQSSYSIVLSADAAKLKYRPV